MPPKPHVNVFISTTTSDLKKYREAAIEICLRFGLDPTALEYFAATMSGATEVSHLALDQADLYIGIFAHRYGYIEDPTDGRSITEIEYDYAGTRGIDRLCFIVDPNYPWPLDILDAANNLKLEAFKAKVSEQLVYAQFTTVANFSYKLTLALSDWINIARRTSSERRLSTQDTDSVNNLANLYREQGQLRQAIDYYEQALAIARETADGRAESVVLGNLGNAYSEVGDIHKALTFFEQSLAISREIGDAVAQATILNNIGSIYSKLGDPTRSAEAYQQALVLSSKVGDRRGETKAHSNIALAYEMLGERDKTIDHYQQALIISREIGDRRSEGLILQNLGTAYWQLGNNEEADTKFHQALTINTQLGDKKGEADSLANIGLLYRSEGDLRSASRSLQKAVSIYESIGDTVSVDRVKKAIADLDSETQKTQPITLPQPLQITSVETPPNSRIFINYRRTDSHWVAAWLHSVMCNQLGKDRIFMDIVIRPGDDFSEKIDSALQQCHVMIVLIGRTWLKVKDKAHKQRLAKPDDWVRIEIEMAIRRGIKIIPVLIDNTEMPTAEDLPDTLQPLARRQAIKCDPRNFIETANKIIDVIENP